MDRIETTYKAIDEMIKADRKPKSTNPQDGNWDAFEEFLIYKEQVGDRYTPLQWKIIQAYFENKYINTFNKKIQKTEQKTKGGKKDERTRTNYI